MDGVHSSVIFRIKHMGVSYFYGRFNHVSGTFTFDDGDASNTSFNIEVKVRSIDTNSKKRERHLKSPDFFNAKQFPLITFKSTEVKKNGDDTFEVTGDLTLHGVTKPLTATFERVGSGSARGGGTLTGFETILTLKRSEFGMNYMMGGLGDEVRLFISIEGASR